MLIVRVALAVPLRRLFDYTAKSSIAIGSRVQVPFGSRTLVGWVVEISEQSDFSVERLKPISCVIDEEPLISPSLFRFIAQCAHYYQHSLGEAIATALPTKLTSLEPAELAPEWSWQITELGISQIGQLPSRSTRQISALKFLDSLERAAELNDLKAHDIELTTLKGLIDKGWVIRKKLNRTNKQNGQLNKPSLTLTDEQRHAVDAITGSLNHFQCFLLYGITGSGKTEVYLNAIAKVVAEGKQALVLIPEIGLTPQTVKRFSARFSEVGFMHSGLTDKQRQIVYLKARRGDFSVIIGTRSAVFAPLENIGLIVIDEEHDNSFKQQDGLRYSSRDMAILRAHQLNIPIVLGSATPSLESFENVKQQKTERLNLTQRATGQQLPLIHLVDCRNQPLTEGLSPITLTKIQKHLDNNNQVLIFINRRGFAPVLLCHHCGHIAECKRCDAHLTLHQSKSHQAQAAYLQCHHCGQYKKNINQCRQCHSTELIALGQGTERIEEFIVKQFPKAKVERIDRDTTRRKGSMERMVSDAKSGHTDILIGTQMLAKGHHFPQVALTVILNIDGGLFSSDFRSPEKMAQLVTQVAGRAGRGEIEGEVIIQTHHPEHPMFHWLKQNDYWQLATQLAEERQQAFLAPTSYMALFRAESHNKKLAEQFLMEVSTFLGQHASIELMGPVASTISRKQGRYRFQLLLNCGSRKDLHQAIAQHLPSIEALKSAQKVRWSLDIDPQDLL